MGHKRSMAEGRRMGPLRYSGNKCSDIARLKRTSHVKSPNIKCEAFSPNRRVESLSPEFLNGRFQCGELGCEVSCKRESDLRRHVEKLHLRKEDYWCPRSGCNRSHHSDGSEMPFPRKDKRDDHVKKRHGERALEEATPTALEPTIRAPSEGMTFGYAGLLDSAAAGPSDPFVSDIAPQALFGAMSFSSSGSDPETLNSSFAQEGMQSFGTTPLSVYSMDFATPGNFLAQGGMQSFDFTPVSWSVSDFATSTDSLNPREMQIPQEATVNSNENSFASLTNAPPLESVGKSGMMQGLQPLEPENPSTNRSNNFSNVETETESISQEQLDAWFNFNDIVESTNAIWPPPQDGAVGEFDASGGF